MIATFIPVFAFLFAAPWAALLTAGAAVSVPIIIHLLNRKRYRIVPWAAMRFLLAAQKQNVRRMRLEQLVLLLVRAAILLLLVAAMASVLPWAEAIWAKLFPSQVLAASLGSQRTHKILVIDGSLSMAAQVGDQAAFEKAREQALDILRDSPSGDGFSVILMADPAQRIVAEPSDSAAKVAEEVRQLRLPHGNADVTATLNMIDDMLRRSPSKYDAREVYFLTDLQRATWTAGRSSEMLETLERIQRRGTTVLVDVGADGIVNLAVTQIRLGVPLATTATPTPIAVTVHNYGGEQPRQARLDLLVGKCRAAPNEPPLTLRGAGQQLISVPPGRHGVTVSFEHKFTTPGDYVLQARLDGDALELDDQRAVVVTVKDEVPVLLVNGKPAAKLYDQAAEYLYDALNPYHASPAPRNVPARPRVLSESQFADASVGDLSGYDCVFLCDVARLSGAEARRLETFLKQGGGVVICLGPQTDLEAYNRLAFSERNPQGILPARLLGVQRAPEQRYFTLFADEASYQQAPLAAFTDDIDKAILQGVPFYQYIRAELPPRATARKVLTYLPNASRPGVGGANAADLPVGDPAIIEWPRYRGRVALITTTVNADWTPWPKLPSFPPLMQELLHLMVANRLREQAATVGDLWEEHLPQGSGGLDVTIETPDKRISTTATQITDDAAVWRFAETDQSGLYRATIGLDPREYVFAVNVPTAIDSQLSSESDLSRANPDELRSAYPGWDFQIVTDWHQVVRQAASHHETSEATVRGGGAVIARYLLLALFVLLLLEVVLAWKFGHYSAASGTAPASGWVLPLVVGVTAASLFVVLAVVLVHDAYSRDFLGFLPDSARAGIERALDVPEPVPGEGSRWRLEYQPYLLGNPTQDMWLAGLLALASIGLVGVVYWFEGATASLGYRLLLAGLRCFLVLLALVVLLPRLHLWIERQGWPDLVILIDDSQSMSAVDNYRDPELREAVALLSQSSTVSEPQRLQLIQTLLTRSDAHWLRTLLTERKFKLHIYRFSSSRARIADLAEPSDCAAAAEAIKDLQATGMETRLGDAIRHVLNERRGSSLTAILTLTDGVTTEGEDVVSVSRYAAQKGVPLFFIGVGEAHEERDLILHDLQVDDAVYVNDRLVFEARLTGQGYTQLTVPVILYEKTPSGTLKELAREMVTVDPRGRPVKVRLRHQPSEPGEKTFIIEVPVQPDEAQPATNNRLERTILVRDAKLMKVLYVEGYPRYEFRFLKTLLERESAEDQRNKTIALQVLLLDADDDYVAQDRSARLDFPPKAELNQFDVIILGDVSPKHPKIGDKNLQHLAEFVKERGGGMVLIAGEQHNPHDYRNTPLEDVLPIILEGGEPRRGQEITESYRPRLTPLGRLHPVFRFSSDEAENAATWEKLAEMFWWSEGYRTQPAAEVLAVHPRREAVAPERTPGAIKEHPLAVQHFVGNGRCLFLGFDETWRWRFREDELHFNQFWIQVVRYLARSRSGRTELRLDRQTPYRRGEPIRVTVRFPDDSPPPGDDVPVKVVVERRSLQDKSQGLPQETEVQTLQLTKLEGSRATYEALLTRTPEGGYRFWLSSPLVGGVKPWAECQVLAPPGEMEKLRMNQSDMERAAQQTGGQFYLLTEADRFLDDLPAGVRVSLNTPRPPWLLWNHSLIFALALLLISAEWVLRKRKHLL
ncbi:MAG: VWA domain-containing protein [Gemmataceae bacterium]